MIPKVTKGDRLRGLLEYLYGPGRFEEHTNPHIVAGYDDPQVLEPPRDEAGRVDLAGLAARLDAPHLAAGERGLRQYVWQCSLSLPPDEAARTDVQWRAIAERFVAGMGLAGEGERAGCRWVAVHHGLSKNGNDHIHVAVTLATEDGTPVWFKPGSDFPLAQQVAGEIEVEFGLVQRVRRDGATKRKEATRGEVERARRDGQDVPDREVLRREVRAAAAGADGEETWIRRMKAAGLLVAPHKAKGEPERVAGYAVALPPRTGKPVWFAGSTLDGDLSLPRIRHRFDDTTPLTVAQWEAVRPVESPALTGPQRHELWRSSAATLEAVGKQLAVVPPGAPEWAAVARGSADLLARVAAVAEPKGTGPVSRAADILARAAAPRRVEPRPASSMVAAQLGRVADALLAAGHARDIADAALLMAVVVQTARLIVALAELREAQRQVQAAGAAQQAAARLLPLLSQPATRDAMIAAAIVDGRATEQAAVTPGRSDIRLAVDRQAHTRRGGDHGADRGVDR